MLEQLIGDVKRIRETMDAMHKEHRELYDGLCGKPLGAPDEPTFLERIRRTVDTVDKSMSNIETAGRVGRWFFWIIAAIAGFIAGFEKIAATLTRMLGK